jgi:hypothetical protein
MAIAAGVAGIAIDPMHSRGGAGAYVEGGPVT